MTLAATLHNLIRTSREAGKPMTLTLRNGLTVRAAAVPTERLCLWRRAGKWGPGNAAEREARVCAKELGWNDYELAWEGDNKYLVMTFLQSLNPPPTEHPVWREITELALQSTWHPLNRITRNTMVAAALGAPSRWENLPASEIGRAWKHATDDELAQVLTWARRQDQIWKEGL